MPEKKMRRVELGLPSRAGSSIQFRLRRVMVSMAEEFADRDECHGESKGEEDPRLASLTDSLGEVLHLT